MALNTEQRLKLRQALRAIGIKSRGLDDTQLINAHAKHCGTKDDNKALSAAEKRAAASKTQTTLDELVRKQKEKEARAMQDRKDAVKLDDTTPTPTPTAESDAVKIAMDALTSALTVSAPQIDESQIIELIKKHATTQHQVTIHFDDSVQEITGAHYALGKLLDIVTSRRVDGTRQNAWLHGEAGTGKTTLASNTASALELDFASSGAILTPYELIGNLDAHGEYYPTPFYNCFKNGGVFLLDEIDACSERALNCINQALANTVYTFPNGEVVTRHIDCIFIGGANTVGAGATRQYNGRAVIDAATRDRFVFLKIERDDNIEKLMTTQAYESNGGNNDDDLNHWINFVSHMRSVNTQHSFNILISPRASEKGAQLIAKNWNFHEVIASVFPTLPSDQLSIILTEFSA